MLFKIKLLNISVRFSFSSKIIIAVGGLLAGELG